MEDTPNTDALEIKEFEQLLTSKRQEIDAVGRQLQTVRDRADSVLFLRQLDNLFEECRTYEARLNQLKTKHNQLEASNQFLRQNWSYIKQKLPKIDFTETMKWVEGIISNFDEEGGEAIFILEDSYAMAGELCLSRIKEKLDETGQVRHLKIDIAAAGGCSDKLGLLDGFARYLNIQIESKQNLEDYSQKIIETICHSIQHGSVVFIELNKWDFLLDSDKTISWFLKDFWEPLIEKRRLTVQKEELDYVKFIVVLETESSLNEDILNLPYYCTPDCFDCKKIVKLPISDWQLEDIKRWLKLYACLDQKRPQIDELAKRIYLKSRKGIPYMVRDALQELAG